MFEFRLSVTWKKSFNNWDFDVFSSFFFFLAFYYLASEYYYWSE